MARNRRGTKWVAILALAVLALPSNAGAAPKYKILHAFGHGKDGDGLWGGLVFDAEGNSYGTTINGGTYNFGTVFELSPGSADGWTESILYSFGADDDGAMPMAGLALDPKRNLYGTVTSDSPGALGAIFELKRGRRGWTLRTLDEPGLRANLILDRAGNLYGPFGAGKYGGGAVSELVKADGWAQKWLYSFCSKGNPCVDGAWPYAGLTWGRDGSLYGTTPTGGSGGYGVAFQLVLQPDGTWKETVLHSFPAFRTDGQDPFEGVVLDKAGNVYGATSQGGGSTGCGVIFKLAPQANGKWKETILYDFPKTSDGCIANTLAFDAKGNLWSTAQGGTSGNGVLFELAPQASGKWKYQVVHQFNGNDGSFPGAAVIFDGKGNLYGTTILGGAYGGGVAFELTP